MNQISSPYQPVSNFQTQQPFYGGGPSPIGGPHAFPQPQLGPQARLQQQLQQHQQRQAGHSAFGGTPTGPGQNGGMIPAGYQRRQIPAQSNPYTTAGYVQSVSAPSATPSLQTARQSASPLQQVSPSPTTQTLQQSRGVTPQRSSMAAPPLPKISQGQQSPSSVSSPHSQPQSPYAAGSPAREKERIALLLDINAELLQEINNLQAQGKGGAQNAQQAEIFRKQGYPDKMASEEYTQTLCRLHANLGYLCGQSDQHYKPGQKAPHPPSFMRPPPNMASLEEKYAALQNLFPGWTGRDGPMTGQTNGSMAQT